MLYKGLYILIIIKVLSAQKLNQNRYEDLLNIEINTNAFPKDFLFGVATSSYQIEGGWNADGKEPSMWDYITQNKVLLPIKDGSTGDVACDSYNNYKKDVQMIKSLGVSFYRFSISWPRVFKNIDQTVNEAGIRYYNNLINELLKYGITPMVTIYHWDMPYALYQEGGLLNGDRFIQAYLKYADLLFRRFGDRVKWWFTFNEPNIVCMFAEFKPFLNINYDCSKNLLLAHARAYKLYDTKYRFYQRGKIGLVQDTIWYEPATSRKQDTEAAERFMQFMTGIWSHPIYSESGDFPEVVKEYVGRQSEAQGLPQSRLPTLSPKEINEIKGTHDFYALNHYTTMLVQYQYVATPQGTEEANRFYDTQVRVFQPTEWPGADDQSGNDISPWLKRVPGGFRKLLRYVKENYGNPTVMVMENGFADSGQIHDTSRIDYYKMYLSALLEAIYEDGVNVKAYAAWSLMDNFEWAEGYLSKFGLYQVDFNSPERTRTPKSSAKWYTSVVKNRRLTSFLDEEVI